MSGLTAGATMTAATGYGSVAPIRRKGAAVLLAVGGAIAVALAGLGVGAGLRADSASTVWQPPAVSKAVEMAGGAPEEIVEMSYGPGQSSGWHVHPVNHTVQVLSGTLAVYNETCQLRLYGAGEIYVGGTSAHLVRNEGAVDVQMIITQTPPAGPADSTRPLHAPSGCAVV